MTPTILNDHIYRGTAGTASYTSCKTVCVTAVLTAIGVPVGAFQSTSTRKNVFAYEGVLRRNGFAVRSRKSSIPKNASVGGARKAIRKMNDAKGTLYMVSVDRHCMLLDADGNTVVDTDPRKVDRRRVLKIRAVFAK